MADDVTRYAMVTDITPLKNGEWVRYEDYAALAAELERVKGERDTARADALRENARLRAVIERDRTGYSRMVTSLRAHATRWSGVASSRGPYEWDDDDYFKEFGRCLAELRTIADRAEKKTHANDWTDCPTTQAGVDAALRGEGESNAIGGGE